MAAENLRRVKVDGAILRSKVRWSAEGEKPTKYFCSLENRQYVNKTIYKIAKNDKIITEQDQILQEQRAYYESLYSSKRGRENISDSDFFKDYENIPKLNAEESQKLEGVLTIQECTEALKSMSNNKSPGSDGFPPEFYKMFWGTLGKFVTRSLNHAFQSGEYSITQKQGVITCLPKQNKDRQLLKNWRPITLLNTDYKIASTVLATRMKNVLPNIIHENQKGFLKGRFIGENTRLVYDLLSYANVKNIPGLTLLLDFEKAFDSIEWDYMLKTLKYFKFGENVCKWVEISYRNINSCVINNGHFSQFFNLHRGVRQGDPLSPYLFITAVELLAASIRRFPHVKGFNINQKEFLLGQYADDSFLLLDG